MKNAVFWDVAPWRSCVNLRFGGTYHLHLQGRKIRERRTSVSRWLQTADWKWRLYVPPKRRFTQDLQGATSQKTAFFIVTSVKTSNLTYFRTLHQLSWSTLYWISRGSSSLILGRNIWASFNNALFCFYTSNAIYSFLYSGVRVSWKYLKMSISPIFRIPVTK
jgi:hypothetical protein